MGKTAPLTEEMVRILRAATDGRLVLDMETWRWGIVGEARPDSRSRKLLMSRGHLRWSHGFSVVVSPSGELALADYRNDGAAA